MVWNWLLHRAVNYRAHLISSATAVQQSSFLFFSFQGRGGIYCAQQILVAHLNKRKSHQQQTLNQWPTDCETDVSDSWTVMRGIRSTPSQVRQKVESRRQQCATSLQVCKEEEMATTACNVGSASHVAWCSLHLESVRTGECTSTVMLPPLNKNLKVRQMATKQNFVVWLHVFLFWCFSFQQFSIRRLSQRRVPLHMCIFFPHSLYGLRYVPPFQIL